MVTGLIAATGLMLCQEMTHLDAGLAKMDDSPQYIVGDATLCMHRTILSPDGSKPLEIVPRVNLTPPAIASAPRLVEGGIVETALIPSKPVTKPAALQCKATFHAKTLEVVFGKGKSDLKMEARGALALLMVESPIGLTLTGFVEDVVERRNSEEMARSRMAAIRTVTERLSVRMPSMSQELRPIEPKRYAQADGNRVLVTAIFTNVCGERVSASQVSQSASNGRKDEQLDRKGGTAVAK